MPGILTAAESSITVVSACLPSLRPFFARVIRRRDRRSPIDPQKSTSPWRSQNTKDSCDSGFTRLHEGVEAWGPTHNVAVAIEGGHRDRVEEYEISGENAHPRALSKGILVNTTVVQEIHERLRYHEELF